MRELRGLHELVRVFEEAAIVHERAMVALVDGSAAVLHHNALGIFGSNKLRDLEQSTQDDRIAKGYSANEPLKRDGALLHDHVEKAAVPLEGLAGVGSAEPVQAAHEYGYYNVRAGKYVAPRPVFHTAMTESAPEIEVMINEAIGITLGEAGSVHLKP